MGDDIQPSAKAEYWQWLLALKSQFRSVQIKAAVAVNSELLHFYWQLGADIAERQSRHAWGSGFLAQLSRDLMQAFPEVKGFSKRNLERIRQWHLYWVDEAAIATQLVAQLTVAIPWGHNLAIISKCQSQTEALYYVQQTQARGWSRAVLTRQIESGLWQRQGQALNNFAQTLPAPQSDLAAQVLKDPYSFDFLSLTPEYNKRALENALLELGAGFAYMGQQVPLHVGEREFMRKNQSG